MKNHVPALLFLVLGLLAGGCATPPPVATPVRMPDHLASFRPVADDVSATNGIPDPRLGVGLATVHRLALEVGEVGQGFDRWGQGVSEGRKKDFTSAETDEAGCLLFRYFVARDMLWNLVLSYADCGRNFVGVEDQTRAFAIGFSAVALLDAQSARLVARFMEQPAAVRKLNEIYTRYDIPAGSYDALFDSVTSPANIRAIREAHRYVRQELEDEDSVLASLVREEPAYATLLDEAERNLAAASADTERILKAKSILLPSAANYLRQNWLANETRRLARLLGDNLYCAQGLLFNNVSDIKRPFTPPVDFNPDQVRMIKGLLQPGDLIFTFTAGYMSNVFLPGHFKHGITYVGSPAERAAMGLEAAVIRDVPPGRRDRLEQDLKTAKLPSGYDADVIEAVAEGVIFNSLDYLLKHHVNRIAVLRPRINAQERVQALGSTFLMLGGLYDFDFDFVDTSYLCCTEVIYRAYDRKGGICFPLIRRMAVQTLAADDILNYHLAASEPRFEFVLLAEEDAASPIHMAVVHTGDAGALRLTALMQGK